MQTYIIRRLLLLIPTIWVASLLVFILMRLIPGDFADKIAAQQPFFQAEDAERVRQAMGLDEPILVQYGRYMGVMADHEGAFSGILQGSIGRSLWSKEPVTKVIFDRLATTVELGFFALTISLLIALPIGTYSAIRQETLGDYAGRSFAILAIAIPNFWLGTMIVVLPSIWWGWSPAIMLIRFTEDPLGNLEQFLIPALVLGVFLSGMTMRMTRTMMLEVLRQDYIRTAWAKGLKERVVILRHALKNALIPVITVVGYLIPYIVGGSVIVEQIFGIPGMSLQFLQAVEDRDYPVVSGIMLFVGGVVLLSNLVTDLAYAYLDPRVRYR